MYVHILADLNAAERGQNDSRIVASLNKMVQNIVRCDQHSSECPWAYK
jgi:hypothetical protein